MAGGGIRTFMTTLAPRQLQGETGQKYLWNMGFGFDGVLQKLDEGVHARFILDAPESALQYIGSDRLVLRGLTESAESYRTRLQRSLEDYRRAGNAWAVLSQVLGYVLSSTPAARTVSSTYNRGTGAILTSQWNTYDAGADTTHEPYHLAQDPGEWDWDSATPSNGSWGWWRWYLVIESIAPNNWTDAAPTWGSTGVKWGGYSGSWGVTTPPNVGRSLKIIVGQWKAGYSHWIVVSFDGTEFRPGASVMPAGEYGRWSKLVGGVYVRARSSNARYFRGQ